MVKTGEVVPVDGIAATPAVTDEAALTGEARPVERPAGDRVRSGAVNAGAPFDLRATATAERLDVRRDRAAGRGGGAAAARRRCGWPTGTRSGSSR